MTPRLKYAKGASAKCYWGSVQYTVKVAKVGRRKAVRDRYFVHYHNWNSRWDEWFPETRLSGPGTGHKHAILRTAGHKRTAASGSSQPAAKGELSYAFPYRRRQNFTGDYQGQKVFEKLARFFVVKLN